VRIYGELAKCFDAGLVQNRDGNGLHLIEENNGTSLDSSDPFIEESPAAN
jgi:hypothetical protein